MEKVLGELSESLNPKFSASKRLINFQHVLLKGLASSLLVFSLLSSTGQYVLGKDPTQSSPIKPSSQINTKGGGTDSPSKSVKKPVPEDIFMVQLKGDADRDHFDSLVKDLNGKLIDTLKMGSMEILVIQAEPGKAVEMQKKLSTSKEVATVERNRSYHINQSVPDDVLYSIQWDMSFMQYSQSRSQGVNYNGPVNMYFLDTGLYTIPGEYAPQCLEYDFSNPWHPSGRLERPFDSGTHGTATASVTCDTNNFWGLAGMANFQNNRVSLVECRISSDGEHSYGLSIIYALLFVYDQMATHRMAPGPVNLSFGSPPPYTLNASSLIQGIASVLRQQGSLLVLAAGNDGVIDPSPELYARRVAAIGQDGTLASFSEFGPFLAAAPGVNIPVYNVTQAEGYIPLQVYESGTSFAAPRWCAAVADVMAVLPVGMRSASRADKIVFDTATVTAQGWHVPNLAAALKAAALVK